MSFCIHLPPPLPPPTLIPFPQLQATVVLQVASLEMDIADYKTKYEEEARLHAITKDSVPKLEKMIIEKDAQLNYLNKAISALEMELKKYKGEVRRGGGC